MVTYQDDAWESEPRQIEDQNALQQEIAKKPVFYFALFASVLCAILLVVLFSQKHGEPRIVQEAYTLGEVKTLSIDHTGSVTKISISILNSPITDERKVKGK